MCVKWLCSKREGEGEKHAHVSAKQDSSFSLAEGEIDFGSVNLAQVAVEFK